MLNPEFIADEVRRACVELEMRHPDARDLMLTGPMGGEGTTTLTCLYGQALAEMSDASVLIVDANFLAPAVHQKYSVSPENGLRDWEPAGSKCVIHAIAAHPRLSVITAGSANGRSLHTLQRNGFLERLAAQLRQDFRYVLWDTAPLIPYPDGRYLLRHVDGVVVVVESDGTTIESLAEFNSVLAESSAQILGVIMNRLGRYAIGARPSASRLQHRISS